MRQVTPGRTALLPGHRAGATQHHHAPATAEVILRPAGVLRVLHVATPHHQDHQAVIPVLREVQADRRVVEAVAVAVLVVEVVVVEAAVEGDKHSLNKETNKDEKVSHNFISSYGCTHTGYKPECR